MNAGYVLQTYHPKKAWMWKISKILEKNNKQSLLSLFWILTKFEEI